MESALLIKLIGSISAIGTTGGGVAAAVVYRDDIAMWLSSDAYLVVKASAIKSGNGTENIYSGNVKNFECKFEGINPKSTPVIYKDCEILLIDDANYHNATNKSIELQKINDVKTINKSDIQKDKYYKIKVKNHLLTKINLNSEIHLTKKDENNSSNTDKFGTFKTLFWITDEKAVSKTQYLLVKAKDAGTNTHTSTKANSKCSFGTPEKPYDCEIWKYKENKTPTIEEKTKKITSGEFHQMEKNPDSSSNIGSITKNSYYLIKFNTAFDFYTNSSFLPKEVIFTEWKADKTGKADGQKLIQTFETVAPVIGESTSDSWTSLHIAQ